MIHNKIMNLSGKIILVAPHPDDEIIGAWTLLNKRLIDTVAFVYYDYKRRKEAENSAKKYEFTPVFLDKLSMIKDLIQEHDIVLVPHPYDHHPHHKQVTYFVESIVNNYDKIMYYSTDMNVWWAIKPVDMPDKKRHDLISIYSSQSKDIEVNRYWWLFEGITPFPSLPVIEVKTHFLGYHRWYNAPPNRAYLRYSHQHEFEVVVRIGVYDLDRYYEFHDLREYINDHLKMRKYWDNMSVEFIAKDLYFYIRKKIRYGPIKVKICEEGGLCGEYGENI